MPDAERDNYARVTVVGSFDNHEERYVLTSQPPFGPGFSIVTPFETTEGRRVMVERGFVPEDQRDPSTRADTTPSGEVAIDGVLRWPQDTSSWTPDADLSEREFYSRSVEPLAADMGTEPILIVQSETGGEGWPRGSQAQVNIRNQHLPYAIQWFALALAWAVMSLFWLRKVARSRRAP